jgi:S-adenosylmethionine:diacylglycerol 3-amino-3-carboxypropyl transferase
MAASKRNVAAITKAIHNSKLIKNLPKKANYWLSEIFITRIDNSEILIYAIHI